MTVSVQGKPKLAAIISAYTSRTAETPLPRPKATRIRPSGKGRAAKTDPQPNNRLSRSRLRTRQKLIEAAQIVMGQKGVEAATIAEIAEQADVGFGSFYNHFKSKTQIAEAVVTIRAQELAKELDLVFSRVNDPLLAGSFVQRWFIERVKRDPIWGWFIIHANSSMQVFDKYFKERLLSDLRRISAKRRLKIPSLETATTITLAALTATMRQQLEGSLPKDAPSAMVEALMRMYGVPQDEAHKIAYEPLPEWLTQADS